jgi:hypothetical protein
MLHTAGGIHSCHKLETMLKENPTPCSWLFSSAALDVTGTSNDMQNRKLKRFVRFKQKCYDPTIRRVSRDGSAKRFPVSDDS